MNNIKVLDCTLRDGGYINNWNFGKHVIKGILANLSKAKIDIIECGFIRNVDCNPNLSVYSSMQQVAEMIQPKSSNSLYAVMIEEHNHVDKDIPVNDGSGADIIRVTFRKAEWASCKEAVSSLINKGYKVCVQPVGTTNYTDQELISLIKDVNTLNPYAFYLVDTLGVMYRNDMRSFFYLIDKNLSGNIGIGFHSHNNLQMSFSNAQEFIRLSHQRKIIIDSSCYGMGRGVGNLTTELLIDYINKDIQQSYVLTPILNIIDRYLIPIYTDHKWGYNLPYLLSATAKCHPNYASYLMNKETLSIENIEKLLSLIPTEDRGEFNEKLIEKLYLNFQSAKVDDSLNLHKLAQIINGKEVVIIGPGTSIIAEKEKILHCMKDKFTITTNFVTDEFPANALFISNEKRFSSGVNLENKLIISTSNLSITNSLVFDYGSLLGEGDAADNSGAMLIRLLSKIHVKKIWLAGFDGFEVDSSHNFVVDEFKKNFEYDFAKKKNEDIAKQLKLALEGIKYELLTKTKYNI